MLEGCTENEELLKLLTMNFGSDGGAEIYKSLKEQHDALLKFVKYPDNIENINRIGDQSLVMSLSMGTHEDIMERVREALSNKSLGAQYGVQRDGIIWGTASILY